MMSSLNFPTTAIHLLRHELAESIDALKIDGKLKRDSKIADEAIYLNDGRFIRYSDIGFRSARKLHQSDLILPGVCELACCPLTN
jgi:hypothetical protein